MPSPSCYHSPTPTWTLTSLMGSYLDLTLAYLFLIGSTLIFFTSKLLSFFNLSLPCPCNNGLFGHCVNDLLLDSARTRIVSLSSSIRSRFPFDAIFDQPLRLTGPETGGDGDRVAAPVTGRRIRRRRVSDRKGKTLAVSVVDSPMRLSWQKEEGIGDNFGCESKEEDSVGCLGFGDGKRIVEDGVSMVAESAHATEYFSVEDTASATQDAHASNQNMELIIRNLERELEEAQAAHASLYLELEKERSSAATAADEAMAMILRLQSEKAAVQMEARQYQRMIEEKSAYDGEEMEILKEIIVRRERENNFLQKEVEAYRQMLSGEIIGEKPEFLFDSSEDPTLMLTTICESIGKKERVHGKMKHTDDIAGIHYPELPVPGEECKEKGIVTVEVYPSGECQNSSFNDDAIGYKLDGAQNLGFCKESSCLCSDDHAGRENNAELRIPVDGLKGDDKKGAKRSKNSSQFEAESSVLDVHVIEDKHKLGVEENEKSSNILKMASAPELSGKGDITDELPGSSNVDISTKTPLSNKVGVEQDIQRSYLEMTIGRQLLDTLSNNTSYSDLRRSPMSSVDSERFKLETEVEILRKRLKTIQQGRENLDFAMGYREKETFQLQLLEEIACQLQEIRKLTGPGRSTRQASLPPLSSKVSTKKRRSRSVSWGLNEGA